MQVMQITSVSAFVIASTIAGAALFAASPTQTTTAAPTTAPASAPRPAAAEMFDIDPGHSKALFRIHHVGAGRFWGRFNDVSGTMSCADGKPEGVMFDVSIKVDSVDTGMEKLDAHLKSADFFNAKEHPTMTFKSTSVKRGTKDGWLDVTGDFTMNGISKPVTATVEWTGTKAGPAGRRAGYEATLVVKRSDWNMKYGIDQGALSDDVQLVVALEGVSQKK